MLQNVKITHPSLINFTHKHLHTDRKGVAMIIAVFTLMVLAILGAALASLQAIDFEASKHQMQSTRAFYLADAGIQHAFQKIAQDTSWRTAGETYTLSYGQYTLSCQDSGTDTVITSTAYIPSVAKIEAKRIIQATVATASWKNAVNAVVIFDWSAMHSGSSIAGKIQATNFDGDNDATYNELGTDYDNPPNAKPLPATGYTRTVSATEVPTVDLDYYYQKAVAVGRNVEATYCLLVADDTNNFRRFNNSLPLASPSDCQTNEAAKDVHGYYSYSNSYYTAVANGLGGLRLVEVYGTGAPAKAGYYTISGKTAYGVFTRADSPYSTKYAYVAFGDQGLQIINITNPRTAGTVLTRTGYLDLGALPYNLSYGVYVHGYSNGSSNYNYAYVVGNYGFKVVNVTTPSSPTLLATYPASAPSEPYYGVYVRGRHAYVAAGSDGLKIIDISNPASPSLRATVSTGGIAYNVYVRGIYAYVACGSAGLKIVNVSNIINADFTPEVTGTYNTSINSLHDVHVSGNYAYVSDNGSARILKVIDVSDPVSPSLAGYYDNGSAIAATGVFVLGDKVFGGANYNNDKVWYTKGNILVDLTLGGSNMLHTLLVAEGDIELVGNGSLTMRAHVDRSANENFPNLVTQNGSILSTDTLSGASARDFDGLIYSQNAAIDFNYITSTALMARYIFLDGVCSIAYDERYVADLPSGLVSGATSLSWQEKYL